MSGRAVLVQAFDILMLEIFVGGNIDGYSNMRFAEFVLRLYVDFRSFSYLCTADDDVVVHDIYGPSHQAEGT